MDPSVFPLGSILYIENVGVRIAVDVGGDVTRRKASRLRGVDFPVVDLYFVNKKDALRFASSQPPFANVTVLLSPVPEFQNTIEN